MYCISEQTRKCVCFKAIRSGSQYFAVELHSSSISHRRVTPIAVFGKMSSEGNMTYIEDLVDLSDSSDVNAKSEIAEFFVGTNILVTGGTGFLGKLLVEKLLRSCPGISKIYMIVRTKKGKAPMERFKENFDSIVYDRLRHEQPGFLNKVVMIEGDAAKEEYGLSAENKRMIMDINIIFHAAADVRFDEKIHLASDTNVKAAKFLLTFAKQLPNFKVFVHVSTAFSQCVHKVIEERHYKDTMDSEKFLTLMDTLDDDKLTKITPVLLGKWPNTYVLTKALAENIVLKHSDDLAVCIVRPSIVISTYKEPIAAWTNNLYGATGIVVGSAVGFIRTLHCPPDNVAEMIPADCVVSNIICSAWDTYNRKAERRSVQDSNLSDEEKVPIYNCVSSNQNPITWGKFMHDIELTGSEIPSTKVLWYYMLILNKYLLVHTILAFFLHTIPAAVADALAYLSGRKPMCLETYRKIHKFSTVLNYFTSREWKFNDSNVMNLWEKMSSTDREIFFFNIGLMDWKDYFYTHVRGIRLYMLNDPLDTLEEGKKKYRKLVIAHYSVVTTSLVLGTWLLLVFLRFLWSVCPFAH